LPFYDLLFTYPSHLFRVSARHLKSFWTRMYSLLASSSLIFTFLLSLFMMMKYNLISDSNLDLDVIKHAGKIILASIVFHTNKASSLFISLVKVIRFVTLVICLSW
jgi:hypothetical protein